MRPWIKELADGLLTPEQASQLLRRFEKDYGLQPHRWLVQERLAPARLISRGADLGAAAAASGFADQSHMPVFS